LTSGRIKPFHPIEDLARVIEVDAVEGTASGVAHR